MEYWDVRVVVTWVLMLVGGAMALLLHRVKMRDCQIPIDAAQYYLENQNESLQFTVVHGLDRDNTSTAYLCSIPQINEEPEEEIFQLEINTDEVVRKGVGAVGTSFSLDYCLFSNLFDVSYWIYGYCFGDKIIQFHNDHEYTVREKRFKAINPEEIFLLASFDPRAKRSVAVDDFNNNSTWKGSQLDPTKFELLTVMSGHDVAQKHSQRTLKHTIEYGQLCEAERGTSRSVEVIYKCVPNGDITPAIIDMYEYRTCHYRMEISVPNLCQIKEFQPLNNDSPTSIMECKSINKNAHVGSKMLKEQHSIYTFFEYQEISFLEQKPRRNLRIQLPDYDLMLLTSDVFWATLKDQDRKSKKESISAGLLYSGTSSDLAEIGSAIRSAFNSVIGTSLQGPEGQVITKQDGFVLWVLVFDIYGRYAYDAQIVQSRGHVSVEIWDPATEKSQDTFNSGGAHFLVFRKNGKLTLKELNGEEQKLKIHDTEEQETTKPTTSVETQELVQTVTEKLMETVTETIVETKTEMSTVTVSASAETVTDPEPSDVVDEVTEQ